MLRLRFRILVLSFFLFNVLTICQSLAQELEWNVGAFGFADNREYKSQVQIPQTIFGLQLAPELGIRFDTLHSIRFGMNILKEFGSDSFIDEVSPLLYYCFEGDRYRFNFGSFSRNDFLGDAPNIIYYDSLIYYRPTINGLFWTYFGRNFSQSVYLDWTSRQTDTRRETFIMGGQGKLLLNGFFLHNYIYMYHFAGPAIPIPGDHLRDNGVGLLKFGYDLTCIIPIDSLSISLSGVQSFERTRKIMTWNTPKGVLLEFQAQFKGFGLRNTLYYGDGHNLDWGDPFYQLKQYNRLDIYYIPLFFRNVSGKFSISLHFAGGNMSHQQQFIITVKVGQRFSPKVIR